MMVLLELPLLERAMEEVFGDDAIHAQLRDVSGFSDATFGMVGRRNCTESASKL